MSDEEDNKLMYTLPLELTMNDQINSTNTEISCLSRLSPEGSELDIDNSLLESQSAPDALAENFPTTRPNMEYLKLTPPLEGEGDSDREDNSLSDSKGPNSVIEDLNLQISDLTRKLDYKTKYLDEQAAEREHERDEFSRKTASLQSKIEEFKKDKDHLEEIIYNQKLEIDDFEIRLKEVADSEQETVTKREKIEEEFKSAVDKIYELREIIRDLEDEIDSATQNAGELKDLNDFLTEEVERLEAEKKEFFQDPNATQDTVVTLVSDVSEDLHIQVQDLTHRLVKKLNDLDNFPWCTRPNSSCSGALSASMEEISVRELSYMNKDIESAPLQLAEGLRQLEIHFDSLVRFEEVILKKLKDTELRLASCKRREEELESEKPAYFEAMKAQTIKISDLENRLDQLRFQPSPNTVTLSGLRSRVTALSEELDECKGQIQLKNIEMKELVNKLEASQALVAKHTSSPKRSSPVPQKTSCFTQTEIIEWINSCSQTDRHHLRTYDISAQTDSHHLLTKQVSAQTDSNSTKTKEIHAQTDTPHLHTKTISTQINFYRSETREASVQTTVISTNTQGSQKEWNYQNIELDSLELSNIQGVPQPTHSTPNEVTALSKRTRPNSSPTNSWAGRIMLDGRGDPASPEVLRDHRLNAQMSYRLDHLSDGKSTSNPGASVVGKQPVPDLTVRPVREVNELENIPWSPNNPNSSTALSESTENVSARDLSRSGLGPQQPSSQAVSQPDGIKQLEKQFDSLAKKDEESFKRVNDSDHELSKSESSVIKKPDENKADCSKLSLALEQEQKRNANLLAENEALRNNMLRLQDQVSSLHSSALKPESNTDLHNVPSSELQNPANTEIPKVPSAVIESAPVPVTYIDQDGSKPLELYLRAKSFRKALTWQKKYLTIVIHEYKDLLKMIGTGNEHPDLLQKEIPLTISSVGIINPRSMIVKFRILGRVVIATIRMKWMVHRWANKIGIEAETSTKISSSGASSLDSFPPTKEDELTFVSHLRGRPRDLNKAIQGILCPAKMPPSLREFVNTHRPAPARSIKDPGLLQYIERFQYLEGEIGKPLKRAK